MTTADVQVKPAANHRLELKKSLNLIVMLVRRDLKVKYRGSILGYLWSMLNPLLFMIIISVVFSFLIRGIDSYPLFILSGILLWNLISTSISLGANAIVHGGGLIKKVRMAIWILPTAPVVTMGVNLVLALLPYVIVFIYMGKAAPQSVWFFPIFLVILMLFIIGISLFVASLNAAYRDVGHVIEPVLQALFYATPIIYDRSHEMVPERVRGLLGLNPLTHFVEVGRKCMFGGLPVNGRDIGLLLLLTGISLTLGIAVYSARRRRFVFEI